MKNITVQEYADIRGITPDGVRKAIRRKHNLPGVITTLQFGKVYVIQVPDNYGPKKDKKKVA